MRAASFLLLCCACAANPKTGDTDAVGTDAVETDVVETDPADTEPADALGQVLLVVLDDVGIDQVNVYRGQLGLAEDGPPTPTLDSLADEGLTFAHAWAAPTCSAMRGALLTGLYSFRTGVGAALGPRDEGLSTSELTFPEQLDGVAETALIGKWHLGSTEATGGLASPNEHGFDHFAGSMEGAPADYWAWDLAVDGVDEGTQSAYAATWKVDEALEWLGERAADEAWVLMVSFNLAHVPMHAPPDALHSQALPVSAGEVCAEADEAVCFDAMVEAMDAELGRLVAGVPDTATVIVVGDNGTLGSVVDAPWSSRHAKGSVYEGGVSVPLLVAGAGVGRRGEVEQGLVQTLDLFSTVIELAGGVVPDGVDAVSLGPLLRGEAGAAGRELLYAEQFDVGDLATTDQAVRDAAHLVVRRSMGRGVECYAIADDPDSQTNLMRTTSPPAACVELEAAMDAIRSL